MDYFNDNRMKNLAIIPARGGSKRIPGKNIREFHGKPIIAYSIENSIDSGLFDEIMVSTDSEEIAEVAIRYGAKVPFLRSERMATDQATLVDTFKEVVANYQERNVFFDNICCMLPTCPLLKTEIICEAYNKLISSDFISVYPVVPFSYPIMRSLEMKSDGSIVMKWPEYATVMSHNLELAYHDSGTFYWHKLGAWMKGEKNTFGIILDELQVQDIDNETDWLMAEMKYKFMFQSR